MARMVEFNWAEADPVVHPVQAVVVYPGQNGVVIRQQRVSDREQDEVITIPHHAIGRLIRRMQLLQNANIVDAEVIENAELVEIYGAD